METENYFHISVTGQIESAYYPLSPDKNLFCRYDVVAGSDWELISGLKSGVTQTSSAGSWSNKVVFNMPIEFTFKSTNPFGWPQIVISLYGTNFWGTETSRGYARVHVPLCGTSKEIRAPILTPKCENLWAALVSWFTDRSPELRDPKILADGTKNKNLLTDTYGELILNLQTISRGAGKLSLVWNT